MTFKAPDPDSIDTASSAIIGTTLSVVGTRQSFPIRCEYLSSFELTATAMSAGIVSGLVVAMMIASLVSAISYLMCQKDVSSSSYSTSMSEIAEWQPTHQFMRRSARKISPSSYRFLNVVRTDNSRLASIVKASRSQSAEAPSRLC